MKKYYQPPFGDPIIIGPIVIILTWIIYIPLVLFLLLIWIPIEYVFDICRPKSEIDTGIKKKWYIKKPIYLGDTK